MKKVKEVLVRIGVLVGLFGKAVLKQITFKRVNLVINVFLVLYAVALIIGGVFYDCETSTTSVGIWVLLAVFNQVMGNRSFDRSTELIDDLIELNDELIETSQKLREQLNKKK